MRRIIVLVTLITLVMLGLAACAGQQNPGEDDAVLGVEADQEVVMQNSTFQPNQITIQVGSTVTWVNQDTFVHTVIAGTRTSPTDLFSSAELGAGETFSFTFEEAGTYNYFCSIHPGMRGQVVVE